MPDQSIRVRFFRVALAPDDWIGFLRLLVTMFETDGRGRLLTIDDRALLLTPFDDQNGYHFGLARTRVKDWPYQMTQEATLVEIDERLGLVSELGHFLFVPRRRLLVVYEHLRGPKHGDLVEFMQEFVRTESARRRAATPPQPEISSVIPTFTMVHEESVYEDFFARGESRRMEFTAEIAGIPPEEMNRLRGRTQDFASSMVLGFQDTHAIRISMKISTGRGREGLVLNRLKPLLDMLRGAGLLPKLRVYGDLGNVTNHEFVLSGMKPLIYHEDVEVLGPYVDPTLVRRVMRTGIEVNQAWLPHETP